MSPQQRLDHVINKLCEVRNEITRNYDVEFNLNEKLGSLEEVSESLAQEVDEEVREL